MTVATNDLVVTMGWAGLKVALAVSVVLYTGMVLMSYSMQGPRYRLKLDPARPARSAEQLAVWLGVRAIGTAVYAAGAIFNTLSEASAQVGEWFIHQRGNDAEAQFHNRFL